VIRKTICAGVFIIATLAISTNAPAEGTGPGGGWPYISTGTSRDGFTNIFSDTSPGVSIEKIQLAAVDDDEFDDEFYDEFDDGAGIKPISDPLEPLNRLIFRFNDKVYFWVLKPAAKGYSAIVPEKGRVGVKRFFSNITSPIRIINSALQLKFDRAGTELARFCINTTVGVLGFMDPAKERWSIRKHKEDFGQTLGRYGAGPGIFINLPFLGPSSIRDGIGLVADLYLDPLTYLPPDETLEKIGVYAFRTVNNTSLEITLYEDLKKDALDPYSFIRDAWHQYRENLVRE
jgi:phospholipid-binding lipoprotein MlaA